jgi:hypothetical protein
MKNLIPTVLWLLHDFLSLKNYAIVASKSNKQKKASEAYPVSLGSAKNISEVDQSPNKYITIS